MPKVSVIIPVYNVEEYLRQALDSVVNQTLEDLEIICVDDCSTDNSLDILKEYASKDSRFKIYQQKENQGQGVARNIALDMATGEYIMFLDPDDWLDIHACEIAYNKIKKNNNDIVFFNIERYYQNSGRISIDKYRLKPFENFINTKQIKLKEIDIPYIQTCEIWYKIYKKSFIDNNSIKFSEGRFGEDGQFSLMTLAFADTISIIDLPLYHYRIHSNSTIANGLALFNLYLQEKEKNYNYLLKLNNKNLLNAFVPYYIRSVLYFYTKFSKESRHKRKYFYNEMRRIFIKLNAQYDLLKYEEHFAYRDVIKIIKYDYKIIKLIKFVQKIFSIKNIRNKKVITIFGIKITIKRGKK